MLLRMVEGSLQRQGSGVSEAEKMLSHPQAIYKHTGGYSPNHQGNGASFQQ